MINVHIYPSSFKYASRMTKQVISIDKLDLFSEIVLLGLRDDESMENEWFLRDRIKIKLIGKVSNLKGVLGKLITFFLFSYQIIEFGKKNKIACINAHTLSVLPVCRLLALMCRAKLIYDPHELETETNSIGSRKFISKLVERYFISKADHVFVVGEKIADWYSSTYNINRPTVIFNAPLISDIKKTDYLREKFSLRNDQSVCIQLGSLTSGRGIDHICNAFSSFNNDNFVVVFMGDGSLKSYVLECAKISNNIFYHEPVSQDEVLKITASADIGLSFVENTCLSYFYSLPNKLFQYVFAGLPVVVSNMMETSSIVTKYGVGEVLADLNPMSVGVALDAVNSQKIYLEHNTKSFMKDFSWERQEEKMFPIYEKFFNKKHLT